MAVAGPDELPVTRVVLYRNGVGYFERAGEFNAGELEFEVRNRDVGDFLSSLTAVERDGGAVTSVSFSIPDPASESVDWASAGTREEIQARQMAQRLSQAQAEEDEQDELVGVTIRFDEDTSHDVMVSYVVGAPIWRPTYRVVVSDDEALLQAWAVIQNVSGENWEDIRLSLTTGAPIAFRSDLGVPITPTRPLFTDRGERITAVPQGTTAYNLDAAPAPPPAPAAMRLGSRLNRSLGAIGRERERSGSGLAAAPASEPASDEDDVGIVALEQSGRSRASAAALNDGVTQYHLNERVTVPDGGSTMVAILSERIPGELIHMFSPNGGVPDSRTHPFRGVRLVNETGAALERGGLSIYGEGTFLGQGILAPLPNEARTFVPFAVDRSLSVSTQMQRENVAGRLVRIANGRITVERFSQRTVTYTVRNGSAEPTRLYVRHQPMSGAQYRERPEGVEESPEGDLIPIGAAANTTTELAVVERTPVRRTVDFLHPSAAEAVGLYLSGEAVDAAAGTALREAMEIREALQTVTREVRQATETRRQLQNSAEQTRNNLEVIRTNNRAGDLRQRLTRRLGELDEQIAALTQQIVEGQTRTSELRVRLAEAIQDISLEP